MEVDTGNSCFIEKLPVERYTSTRETKKPPETNKSPAAFVNHAAIAWHENRRKWVGEVSRKSERMPKDPVISRHNQSQLLSYVSLEEVSSCAGHDIDIAMHAFLYLKMANRTCSIYSRVNKCWTTTYEELLSTTDPFSERIPLTEMVDFLVDIWHDEGLFD
ncbi:hypothetical protein H5410_054896 [Solanum commersonii]|uniref:Gag1-like clamp domain-containing protein n=1 Tax=Solanum commersonii TaxID=4109 RepID=A0A9J5WGM1_SOLCO|nr:hypothetical protein H5410_054896 [Solanum commersonii]